MLQIMMCHGQNQDSNMAVKKSSVLAQRDSAASVDVASILATCIVSSQVISDLTCGCTRLIADDVWRVSFDSSIELWAQYLDASLSTL